MATKPQFTVIPKVGIASISTLNAGRDGSGTLGTVFTAGASGSRIDKAIIKATVTTTAGMVRLFIHDGASAKLLTEIPVTAITVAANTPAFETVIDFLGGLVLPTGYSLRAAAEKAEIFNILAFGGDF